jgi:hypothetical protein
MALIYPEETQLEDNRRIINDVLEQKVCLTIKSFSLKEDFKNDCSCVSFLLCYTDGEIQQEFEIYGEGSGVIDAIYTGILKKFESEYISLRNVALYDFLVSVKFQESRTASSTDAPVEVKIGLVGTSSSKSKLYFKAKSNSIVKSGLMAVCNAMEYLINSERTVTQLCKDIEYASKRQRVDLKEKYISKLSELVNFISYSEVVEKSK